MDFTENKLREVSRYSGRVVEVVTDYVSLPDGGTSFREVIRHPGGVGVLPVDSEGNAWLVRQYRYCFAKELLEIPAGKLEPGEEHRPAAIRELGEETGLTAGELIYLGASYSSPGIFTEVLHLYLALDLHQGAAHPDEGEFVDTVKMPFEELLRRVYAAEIHDAKTVIAVLKAAELLGRRELR